MARKSSKRKDESQRASGRLNANRMGTGPANRNTVLHGDGVYRVPAGVGGVTDHGALTGLADDDHTQYQLRTEKAAAGGYASLDGSTLVPVAQLPDATTLAKGIVKLAGDLAGTAALPVIAPLAVTDAKVAAANKDGLAATPSMRTLGTGAQQAGAGDTSPAAILTTKGDILGRNATAPDRIPVSGVDGKALHEDSSNVRGVSWAYASAFPGDVAFGSGVDGSSTLVANTVVTDFSGNFPILYYTTLDIATFTLTTAATDLRWRIYCSTLLTGNGGEIFAQSYATGGVIAGGVAGGGGGKGGDSGLRGSFLQVFAKERSGSGTISCNGDNAQAGGNATLATATANGAAGGTGTNTCTFRNVSIAATGGVTQGGGGASAGTGGTAGSGTAVATDDNRAFMRNPQQWIIECEFSNVAAASGIFNTHAAEPDGAAAGGRNTGAQGGGGGGSAGGGYSFFSQSVGGSPGGAGLAGAAGAGGGGGGAGGPGGILTVVCRRTTATWTDRANGGNGGKGGDGFGRGGGGGGGPGGGGGWVRRVLGYGSPVSTAQANGGTGGAVGAGGSGGGAAGTIGNDGNAGWADTYVS